jgi:hypothetical protein
MPLVLAGATSGSTTIQATDAVTQTITLPNATGTVLTTGNIPTGSVLQVVNATYAIATSNSTNTPASTGLTASITPSSSSNKILVIANVSSIQNNNSGNGVNLLLYRNASTLFTFGTVHGYTNSAIVTVTSGGGTIFLDSPSTTSATSYTVYFSSNAGGGQVVTTQANNATSTITLMEIKG